MNPSSPNSNGTENPQHSANCTLSLEFLCKLISTEFSGNRYDLGQFLANCNNANHLASENQKIPLLFYILSKITGRAKEQLAQQSFQSWEDLKCKLKDLYQDKKHYCQLMEELNNSKQNPNENISQYFQRIELLNARALSAVQQYTSDPNLLQGKIHTINEITLNRFIYHSHPAISQMLRWKDFDNLNAAFTAALTEEKALNIHKPYQKRLFCKICKRTNHETSQCKSLSYQTTNHKPNSHPINFSKENPLTQINATPKICSPIEDIKLASTGILQLREDCKAYTSTHILETTSETTTTLLHKIPNFNIANDECCVQKSINITNQPMHLSPIKLVNANLEELQLVNHKLNQLNMEITKQLNQPLKFHSNTSWYSTILSLLGSFIGLVILYKVTKWCGLLHLLRKILCSTRSPKLHHSGCCAKIFNTNISGVPVTREQLSKMIEEEEDFESNERVILMPLTSRKSIARAPSINMD
ncbi:hypothetical protein FQR65_LT15707 [Abscondita terminalis]|nr:hypothetical protein FQR65_LT15707 [Abscondita terminalis]